MKITPTMKYGFVAILLIVIIFMSARNSGLLESGVNKTVAKLTNEWIRLVTEKKDPDEIYKLFCGDGILVGTVSQVERKGENIKKYFDYFAKLPELEVIDKKFSISEVDKNVYVNNAWITWNWKGLEKPIVARMTFIFKETEKKWCLFELHSSALPDLNKDLLQISGEA